ncbi:MAG TPA: recombination-associated protein RdgC [Xanthomonadales bacterium]|nr:recombination-associated protein RdgC [Xanthomonadales bacterium]
MFRNLRFYRVISPWPESEQELSDILANKEFSPCSAFSERSAGWEPPAGPESESLSRSVNGADLMQLRTQSRVLPLAAIKEALEVRVAEYRARMEQDPPRAELRRLREETRDELLPKALVKSERMRAFYLQSDSLLVIDVATDARAEWFIDHLRFCFSSFRCVPLAFNAPPAELLTRIFMGESLARFTLGRECRMQDLMDSKAIATWRDIDLSDASIRQHVLEGMKLTHLGVEFDRVMTCVFSEDAVFGKVRFNTGEAVDQPDTEDPLSRLDADFVLLSGTVSRLIRDLCKLLGGFTSVEQARTHLAQE